MGKVGTGYEIPTEAQYREIHRFIVRYYMVVLPVPTGAAIFLKWIALLALPVIIIPTFCGCAGGRVPAHDR